MITINLTNVFTVIALIIIYYKLKTIEKKIDKLPQVTEKGEDK